MTRVGTRVAGLALLVLVLAACRIPSPLTYPLLLSSPPADVTTEINRLLGDPQPRAETPLERARQVAQRLTRQHEGCEVFTIAQVIWVEPAEANASAAIEERGTCDDAIQGAWYELTFTGDSTLGWVVETATRQDICARGVSGGLCV